MTLQIERVEDWLGKNVVGPEQEKIGRLEDVVFGSDAIPLYGTVSTGLFGRRTSLVPLADATLSPDHVGVPYTKTQVKDAPQLDSSQEMSATAEDAAAAHYGRPQRVRAADERYVTATERVAAAQEAAALEAQASRQEHHADDVGSKAAQARADARDATASADALTQEHAEAVALAQETRGHQAELGDVMDPPR